MVPIVTALLILVAIAIIAIVGLPPQLKQVLPRQLTYEYFETTTDEIIPEYTPDDTTPVNGATDTPLMAAANLSAINVTEEALSRVATVEGLIDMVKMEDLIRKYILTDMAPLFFIDSGWRIYSAIQAKYDAQYPNSTTALAQVYVASLQLMITELLKYTYLKTSRTEPLILALKTWFPTPSYDSPTVAATPYSNLASNPATVGMNNFGGNQFSLATITVPISTSDSLLKDMTAPTTGATATTQQLAVPANMAPSGPAPALSGGETDALIINLVRDTLRAELSNLGKADKVAITSKSTPGLSQGDDFKKTTPKSGSGMPPNPNGASDSCGYNHLGPLSDYQDNFHPPLMPDGGYYDPRYYVRKDSIPCNSCSLDY